jgi:hypothetical protein
MAGRSVTYVEIAEEPELQAESLAFSPVEGPRERRSTRPPAGGEARRPFLDRQTRPRRETPRQGARSPLLSKAI